MLGVSHPLSRQEWLSIVRKTSLITVAAAFLSHMSARVLEPDNGIAHVMSAVVIIALLCPVTFVFLLKLSELAVANRKLSHMATIDGLTNCLNRNAFATQVEAVLGRMAEVGGQCRGVFMVVDADHFKAINDQFGHLAGDTALRMIVDRIKSMLRDGDIVGRLGGEEFGVFMPGVDMPSAEEQASRILQLVERTELVAGGRKFRLSISIGGACFDAPATFTELFRTADRHLYRAKAAGRNRVVLNAEPQGPGGSPLAA